MISFFITQINTFLTRKDHLCNLTKMTERWKSMKRRTECNWKMERHSNAEFSYITILIKSTAWKVTICGVFSGPYFPVFGLNTYRVLRSKPRYSVQIKENTPYLDTFHAAKTSLKKKEINTNLIDFYPLTKQSFNINSHLQVRSES